MSVGWECLSFNIKDGFVGAQQLLQSKQKLLRTEHA